MYATVKGEKTGGLLFEFAEEKGKLAELLAKEYRKLEVRIMNSNDKTSSLLKSSIAREDNKTLKVAKENQTLYDALRLIEEQETTIATLTADLEKQKRCFGAEMEEVIKSHAYLDVFLDEQEAIWDRQGKLESPEIAIHYLAAANHRRTQGRTGDRIDDVQNWIDRS